MSNVDGSVIKPRRSLVHTDVVSQLEAEDLSRSGKHQGQELRQGNYQFWQSMQNSSQRTVQGDRIAGISGNAMNMETGRPAVFPFTDEVLLNPVDSPYWSVENGRRNDSGRRTHLRPSTAESGSSTFSPSAESSWSGGQKVPHSADEMDVWLSASVIQPVEKSADGPLTGQTSVSWSTRGVPVSNPAQLSQHQPFPAPSSVVPPSVVPGLHSGTTSSSRGVRNTSAASRGPARHVTVFLPTDENSAVNSSPPDVGSELERFPSRGRLDSSGGMSSSYMFLRSPDLLPVARARGLAASWPISARGFAEPSPVATVKPQMQMAALRPDQHSAPSPSRPTGMVPERPAEDLVAASETSLDPAAPQMWKRKRKRRSLFGTRRRRRKTQQTTPAAAHQHLSTSAEPVNIPAGTGKAAWVTTISDAGVDAAKSSRQSSSLAYSGVLGATKPAGMGCITPVLGYTKQQQSSADVQKVPTTSDTTRPTASAAKSASTSSVSALRRVLKPIENQQRSGHFFTSEVSRPLILQRAVPGATKPTAMGRNTPVMSYIKQRQPSSADVQEVPTTSRPRDIFEFCGDDDEFVPTRLTPKSFHSTPAQAMPVARKTLLMVDPARQKCEKIGNFVNGRRLR